MMPLRKKFRIDYKESDFSRSRALIPEAPEAMVPIENPELSFHHLDRIKINNALMLTKEMILAAINAIEPQPDFVHVARGIPDVLEDCPRYLGQMTNAFPQQMCSRYFGKNYEAIISDISKGLHEMNQYLSFVGNKITFFNICYNNSEVDIMLDYDPHETSELVDPNICIIGMNMSGSRLTVTKEGLASLVLREICLKVLLTQNLVRCDPSVRGQWERRERCRKFARFNPELAIRDTSCWISFIDCFSKIHFA